MHLISKLILMFFVFFGKANSFCGTKDDVDFATKLIIDINEQKERNLWSNADRHKLSFCIDNNFKNEKTTIIEAMGEAVQAWEEYANVTFSYLKEHDDDCNENNENVLFRVKVINSRRVPYSAKAFFPYAKSSKRNILFKRVLIKGNYRKLVGIAKHELGHVLGFRHEHIHPLNNRDCNERNPFEPITPYDTYSIMHYLSCGGTSNKVELSEQDKIGAALAYP